MRMSKKLAAVALAFGGLCVGGAAPAAATTGAQLAACSSATENAHLQWFDFTKTDGTKFCVGGGTGTVAVTADIKAFDTFGYNTTPPVTRYYGYLDVLVGGQFNEKWYIGVWPSAQVPIGDTDYWSLSLPCPPPAPPYYINICPVSGSSLHVTGVEIVGSQVNS